MEKRKKVFDLEPIIRSCEMFFALFLFLSIRFSLDAILAKYGISIQRRSDGVMRKMLKEKNIVKNSSEEPRTVECKREDFFFYMHEAFKQFHRLWKWRERYRKKNNIKIHNCAFHSTNTVLGIFLSTLCDCVLCE